ncbi:ComEC/Rec2 family competence protein [Gemmobacter denitrificans]|uniref:ComEC/Rec2 family competence protein n=1 Tax=Gemmobacter denitrificans TaxID=3123040 RepID=A0ABU8BS16_9RHOB
MQRIGLWMQQVALWPVLALAEARGILFPWVPVFLACGIGWWFGRADEPDMPVYAAAAAVVLLCVIGWRIGPHLAQPFWVATGCVAAGVLLCGLRVMVIASPVLEGHYYGPVSGRIVEIDRSQSDALRLTLDLVVLDGVAPGDVPIRVRISVQGDQRWLVSQPGARVQVTAHLSPPRGPVEPGAFDFQRNAWFRQIGAVGYTRHPVLPWAPPSPGEQWVGRLRSQLSAGIQAAIPGDAGAFASGVMTGDRSGLSGDAVAALRDSSLAHLLAISGMNMVFLTGFVFALCRGGVALVPFVALRINAKKIAAVLALGVAGFYLLLSGANVPTERAFIMVVVMLGAILVDRRALSLRSVAMSAVILLALRPETLFDAGFQMSFAATTMLIAGFGALEGGVLRDHLPRWVLPVFTLVLSSAIGGLATGPYAAAHFNRIADLGFFANLLTVPVMGVIIMPAGALAALLAPLGLADLPLWIMGLGCDWVLQVAHWVAAREGAVTAVPAPGPAVLLLISLAGIWLAVWRGWGRFAAVAPLGLAFVLWSQVARPDLLIAEDAALVGLAGPEGRALSVARGGGFAAENWLAHDGDLAAQAIAARRAGFSGPQHERRFVLGPWRGVHLRGKTARDALQTACLTADLVIIAARVTASPGDCVVIDQTMLAATGALAIHLLPDGGLQITSSRGAARVWHDRPAPMASLPHNLPPPALRLAQGPERCPGISSCGSGQPAAPAP